jgi:chromosome segregation ATPase
MLEIEHDCSGYVTSDREQLDALQQQVEEMRFSLRRLEYSNLELDTQLRDREHRNWEMNLRVAELQAREERTRQERDLARADGKAYQDYIHRQDAQLAELQNEIVELRLRLLSRPHRLADWADRTVRRVPAVVPVARVFLRALRWLRVTKERGPWSVARGP